MYSDFAGLAQLREDARGQSPEAVREAARQFEALFVQMMLQSMRDANAVLGEDRDTTYEQMFDRQISLELTRNKGLGIAEMLMRQLAPDGTTDPAGVPVQAAALLPQQPKARTVTSAVLRQDWQPQGRAEFVRDILPLAETAAAELGIDPRVLVAQSALETGWGQRMIRDSGGTSSNNLFGIKASGGWGGDSLSIPTLEYENGAAARRRESFRVYTDLAQGFADYVALIKNSPRYADAVGQAADPDAYLEALQEAGYATDPNYASKIKAILHGPDLSEFVAKVKNRS